MATSENLGLYLPTRDDYISVKRDISDNMEIIDAAVGGTMGNISNIDNGLAYVAVKVGNNWQLPSGKTAYAGDFVILNGVFGHATAMITGGSTNIVENTNWVAETNGGLNALVSRNKSPYYGSLKQISNALLISTPLDSSANDVGIVTNSSQYAPTDLIIGIREVFYFSSTKIAVVIHGVDTKNIYREWYRYYNGSLWTDWFGNATTDDISNWESVAITAGSNVTIYNTSVVKKNTLLKLVSVGVYLIITGAVSAGSVLLSGLPLADGNGNFEAVNYKADTSKFANAVFINNSGELCTRENISSGDTIMLTTIYKMV